MLTTTVNKVDINFDRHMGHTIQCNHTIVSNARDNHSLACDYPRL